MFGADIEFFITDKDTGKLLPACGKVGGTKDKAIPLDKTYSILEDGAAVELNYAPAVTPPQFIRTIARSTEIIKKYTKFGVHPSPEVKFGSSIKKFPQAMEIGCLEDFDAYATFPTHPRMKPDISKFGNYRFAGGHLHLSYENKDVPAWVAARMIDLFVTVPLMRAVKPLEREALLGAKRKDFYGLPGIYRPKEYGVEYRTLSNKFSFSEKLIEIVAFGLAKVEKLMSNAGIDNLNSMYMKADWDVVKRALTGLGDKDLKLCTSWTA